jgi:hypothetical protein
MQYSIQTSKKCVSHGTQNLFEKPLFKVPAYTVLNNQWYFKLTNEHILLRQQVAIIFYWTKKLLALDNGKHDKLK